MSIVGTATQQPSEVMDYDIEFGEWLPAGDAITSAVISVSPTMVTPPSYAINGSKVKVWVYAGGLSGLTYQITVRAITSDGRQKEVEFSVLVLEY